MGLSWEYSNHHLLHELICCFLQRRGLFRGELFQAPTGKDNSGLVVEVGVGDGDGA